MDLSATTTLRARVDVPPVIGKASDDYGPRLLATTWTLTAFAALFLGLRIASKLWRRKGLWWDDYVLFVSWLSLVATCICLSISVSFNFGKHSWVIPPEMFDSALLYSYCSGFCSIMAALFSKVSFALTLLKITKGPIYWILWFIAVSVSLTLCASGVLHWVQCWPFELMWRVGDAFNTCLARETVSRLNVFFAVYSGAADISLALLPWFIIWFSAISKREKFGVILSMSMGLFAGVTSFLKIPTITAIESHDIIDSVQLIIYGLAEGAATIMAVSIPMLRAYVMRNHKPKTPQIQSIALAYYNED